MFDILPFLNFVYAAVVQGMPIIGFGMCLFLPLFLIGSTPHIIKKLIFFWK